jgi:hypothetical protein
LGNKTKVWGEYYGILKGANLPEQAPGYASAVYPVKKCFPGFLKIPYPENTLFFKK